MFFEVFKLAKMEFMFFKLAKNDIHFFEFFKLAKNEIHVFRGFSSLRKKKRNSCFLRFFMLAKKKKMKFMFFEINAFYFKLFVQYHRVWKNLFYLLHCQIVYSRSQWLVW